MLVYTKSAIKHRVLASTQRGITNPREKGSATAVGEMLDKCARDSKSFAPLSSLCSSLLGGWSYKSRSTPRPPAVPTTIVSPTYTQQTVVHVTHNITVLPETFLPAGNDAIVYAKLMHSFCMDRPQHRMRDAYNAPKKRQDEIQIYESENGSWFLPPPLRQSREMKYEFTGLGGKVRAIMSERPDMEDSERAELAYQTMRLAFEHIMSRVILALQNDEELLANPPQSLVISGGVASNPFLRTVAASMLQARGFGNMNVTAPTPALCTDNAQMIAWAGQKMYNAGWTTDLSFLPQDEWPIERILTGVDCWVKKRPVIRLESAPNATASQQDKIKLPENSKRQEPPLPSTPNAPLEPSELDAPDAEAAYQSEAQVKSVTPIGGQFSETTSKNDDGKATAKPVPGRPLSQDERHAPDSEVPDSQQEGAAQTSSNEAADRPAQQRRRTPRARKSGNTKAAAQPTRDSSDTDSSDDPMTLLNKAEEQLLGPTVRRVVRAEGAPDLTLPTESHARAQVAKPPATKWYSPERVKKERTYGAGRGQSTAQTREQVPAPLSEARVSSPDFGRTARPRLGPSGKPPTKPVLRSGEEGRRGAEMGGRVPRRGLEVKEEEAKKKDEEKSEDKKSDRRIVRLLPPAPADKPAPTGALRAGLNKLKGWIGL